MLKVHARLRIPIGLALVTGLLIWGACASATGTAAPSEATESALDAAAETYVDLVLALAEHWPDFLDSYYGTEERRTRIQEAALALAEVRQRAAELTARLRSPPPADGEPAERLVAVAEARSKLGYAAAAEAARRYFDGELDRERALQWLVEYGLWSPEHAEMALGFLEDIRSFVINCSLGHRLVREHVESRGATADQAERRWEEFERLLLSPRIASTLERSSK